MSIPLSPSPGPSPLDPWQAREDWHAAALMIALVLVPETCAWIDPHANRFAPGVPGPTGAQGRRLRRPGRHVRPPRSC